MPAIPDIKALLDEKVAQYNTPQFITADPVSIPHRFTKMQDVEIAGFFAATLAWGNRTSIINSCNKLLALMDGAPHDFVLHHEESDRRRFLTFVHRTFNATDLIYFIHFLQHHYQAHHSLETAFLPPPDIQPPTASVPPPTSDIQPHLTHFHHYFFALPHAPERTRKHVSTPARNSACKRLCMYLRWMVRKDAAGVDFGLWKTITPMQLICPLDVHVARVARRLGLLSRNATDWKAALELTGNLRQYRPDDPAAYDYALFGMGVEERW